MTDSDTVTKLRQAKGGSRELSDEVLLALGWGTRESDKSPHFVYWIKPDGGEYSSDNRPDPTTNLQDAVDLVPEDAKWGVDSIEAWVRQGDDEDSWGSARTPALSLCIAVLKAKEPTDDPVR